VIRSPVLAVALAAAAGVGVAACASTPASPDAPSSAWSLGPTMPRRALEPGVAALGQQVVVAGGFDTSLPEGLDITARVDTYDPTDEAWRALPDLPVRWTHGNLAVVGGTLYLAGGLEGVPYVAHGEAFVLDPLGQGWQPIAAIDPADARGASGVVTAPGRIYLLGGMSSTAALATCLEYDVAANRWTHLPDLPAPRSHPAAMRMADGTLIVAGGLASFDASEPRGEVWALPPPGAATRTWQPRTAMHQPADPDVRGGCAYGVALGELVCAGGEGGQTARKAVDSYDPYLDQWTMREPMPIERAGAQGAVVGGRLFVPGGAGGLTFDPTDTLYVYAPLDTAAR
jgi:N-acetylneuraminic acid mutarotase